MNKAKDSINQTKIQHVMAQTGCDRATATAYLQAEEWNMGDAIISLRGDAK